MTQTHTTTFEISVSAGGVDDEVVTCEVEVTAEIEPYVPMIAMDMNNAGEPESGGYADVIKIEVVEKRETSVPGLLGAVVVPETLTHDASWLIAVLPKKMIEQWGETIYEDHDEPMQGAAE